MREHGYSQKALRCCKARSLYLQLALHHAGCLCTCICKSLLAAACCQSKLFMHARQACILPWAASLYNAWLTQFHNWTNLKQQLHSSSAFKYLRNATNMLALIAAHADAGTVIASSKQCSPAWGAQCPMRSCRKLQVQHGRRCAMCRQRRKPQQSVSALQTCTSLTGWAFQGLQLPVAQFIFMMLSKISKLANLMHQVPALLASFVKVADRHNRFCGMLNLHLGCILQRGRPPD